MRELRPGLPHRFAFRVSRTQPAGLPLLHAGFSAVFRYEIGYVPNSYAASSMATTFSGGTFA